LQDQQVFDRIILMAGVARLRRPSALPAGVFLCPKDNSDMTRIKRCWRPQGRFLREFARTGSVSLACRASGLARRTVYRWREADADFRRRWATARGRAGERQRDAAMERALFGEERPLWRNGAIVDHVQVPDSDMLWKLLQAMQAETYGPQARELQARRERAAELTRRLDEADKRVAGYEAELRRARANTDRDK